MTFPLVLVLPPPVPERLPLNEPENWSVLGLVVTVERPDRQEVPELPVPQRISWSVFVVVVCAYADIPLLIIEVVTPTGNRRKQAKKVIRDLKTWREASKVVWGCLIG